MTPISDRFAADGPNPQQTVDLFRGEWGTAIPGLLTGAADLSNDPRIEWADQRFSIDGKTILELGPLEATHTRQLLERGAKRVVAIEANSRHFLKCLVLKELFDLRDANFLYGDFIKYFESSNERVDVVIASGVLYHMQNPLKLLHLISQHTDRILLWTHYFDEPQLRAALGDRFEVVFKGRSLVEANGFRCNAYTQHYGVALDSLSFSGGLADTSAWLARGDILNFLETLGFTKIETAHEGNTVHGPAFTVAAARSGF